MPHARHHRHPMSDLVEQRKSCELSPGPPCGGDNLRPSDAHRTVPTQTRVPAIGPSVCLRFCEDVHQPPHGLPGPLQVGRVQSAASELVGPPWLALGPEPIQYPQS
jgi:hypothetical protein